MKKTMITLALLLAMVALVSCGNALKTPSGNGDSGNSAEDTKVEVMVPTFIERPAAAKALVLDSEQDSLELYYNQFAPTIKSFVKQKIDIDAGIEAKILGNTMKLNYSSDKGRQIIKGELSDTDQYALSFMSDYDGKDSFDYVQKMIVKNVKCKMYGSEFTMDLYTISVGNNIQIKNDGSLEGNFKYYIGSSISGNDQTIFTYGDGKLITSEDLTAIEILSSLTEYSPDFFTNPTKIELATIDVLKDNDIVKTDKELTLEARACAMFFSKNGKFTQITNLGYITPAACSFPSKEAMLEHATTQIPESIDEIKKLPLESEKKQWSANI